ncbi:M20/M25/M40 family metallo-hydrolase [Arthrobacter sp. alpha11c]
MKFNEHLPQTHLPPATLEALAAAVDANMAHYVTVLSDLVRVPGVAWAGFDPHALDLSARRVHDLFLTRGFDVSVVRAADPTGADGAPGVVARRPAAPGLPTVLLYAHHDVQPSGALDAWDSEPFSAMEKDGRLWGRGAADDKAGIVMHLAAIHALDSVLGPDHGLGLTVFVEGEEEAGSPSLQDFMADYGQELVADAAIVADSGSWKIGIPGLTTSLRGLVDGTIRVRVLDHALHSGTYGGPVVDALTVLARLMATFHNADGSVAVEGLVEGQSKGMDLDAADLDALDLDEAVFRRDAGVPEGLQLAGTGSLTSRLWSKPALSFVGLDSQAIATAGNVLLPEATVKFSLRLPPGNHPDQAMEAVRRHALKNVPFGAEVTFTPGSKSMPFRADSNHPVVRAALWSLGQAWGAQAVSMGVGGSIPFVAALAAAQPQCSIIITGAEDPDSRAHGANESVHLGELRNAILAEALFLAALQGGVPPGTRSLEGRG